MLGVLLVASCGGDRTLTGKVSYKSQPLTKGQISFVGEGGKSASGTINNDGTYFVKNPPLGVVTVTVLAYQVEGEDKFGFAPQKTAPPMKSAVPVKYNEPSTSGLKYTIERKTTTLDIDLVD